MEAVFVKIGSWFIQPQPVVSFSILPDANAHRRKKYPGFFAGDRWRHSTCTSVAWFPDGNALIALNLGGESIHVYEFNKAAKDVSLKQVLTNKDGLRLALPEIASFSGDGALLGITNFPSGEITLYAVDPFRRLINPKPALVIKKQGDQSLHGMRFSRSDYFAVTVRDKNVVRIYRVIRNPGSREITTVLSGSLHYPSHLKPKGVDFTIDQRFIAVVFAPPTGSSKTGAQGLLTVHPFDEVTGKMDPTPVSSIDHTRGLSFSEDVRFFPDASAILVSNQASDTVSCYEFDGKTGQIGGDKEFLRNPESRLGIPHGIDISTDGKYVAVANYEGSQVCIYEVVTC